MDNLVVAANPEGKDHEFLSLLDSATETLKVNAAEQESRYLTLLGNRLEGEVFEVLQEKAKGTVFEGTIELISGQKFPDIIARNYYGVEVKSTKSNQ